MTMHPVHPVEEHSTNQANPSVIPKRPWNFHYGRIAEIAFCMIWGSFVVSSYFLIKPKSEYMVLMVFAVAFVHSSIATILGIFIVYSAWLVEEEEEDKEIETWPLILMHCTDLELIMYWWFLMCLLTSITYGGPTFCLYAAYNPESMLAGTFATAIVNCPVGLILGVMLGFRLVESLMNKSKASSLILESKV